MSKSRSSSKDSGDYAVGNCRPPKETRFKPGQSGNPKGKAKGSLSIGAQIEKQLQRKISVTENGVKRRLPLQEVMLASIAAKAVKGDLKAAEFLIRARERHEDNPAESLDPTILHPDDQALIAAFLENRQIGADAERSEPVGSSRASPEGTQDEFERTKKSRDGEGS
jgi:hypothetical protein